MARPAPLRTPLAPRDPRADVSANHYWRYHDLEALLACKRPVTASLDEDLFISIHQASEICFHQMIVDLERTLDAMRAALDAAGGGVVGDTGEACYFLERVVRLWGVVHAAVPILGGMRAFAEFRQSIGPSSGFQSYQFRRIEILSGVERPYWQGGTRDAAGQPHVAETEFERRFGAEVAAWLERHRRHSLRWYYEALCQRAPGGDRAARVASLRGDVEAAALCALLADYDQAQLRFHRLHLGLAVQQLELVGVEYGTGGTSFRDYLARYERELAPLFSGLEPR